MPEILNRYGLSLDELDECQPQPLAMAFVTHHAALTLGARADGGSKLLKSVLICHRWPEVMISSTVRC